MTEGLGQRRRLWLSPCGRGKVVVRLRHAVNVVKDVLVWFVGEWAVCRCKARQAGRGMKVKKGVADVALL